jgi:plastocyanin
MRRVSSTCLIVISLYIAASAVVAATQTVPRITRIEFSPAPEEDGGGVVISLLGSGECSYTMDYGDGKTERRTATLPDRMRHGYAADGQYTVVATPDAPCEGVARAQLDIRAIARGIWRVSVEPGPATDAAEIVATIHGRGACVVMMSFGDGKQQKVEGTLPAKVSHTYEKPGTYELHAVAAEPCRGEVLLSVDVRR